MRLSRVWLLILLAGAACSGAAPPPPLTNHALRPLLAERKFEPGACYTGADTPEDRPALERAVNDAIRDVGAMPSPVERAAIQARLERLVRDVDSFATEDREESYRYAIRIWRAAGLQGESHLFPRDDARVLAELC